MYFLFHLQGQKLISILENYLIAHDVNMCTQLHTHSITDTV